jgi:hypothetical protein
VEELFGNPIFGPARLNRARFVSFRQFVRHLVCLSPALAESRGDSTTFSERRRECLILQAREKKGQTFAGRRERDGLRAPPCH